MKSIFNPRYVEIIALLRAAREHKQVSQVELARRLGRPQSYVSKVETCERRIDLLELLTFCDALGITLKRIIPSELNYLLGDCNGDE
jgi:transcriptional regulator with XRE-family HTH domain